MLTGLVHVGQSLALRVALITQGIDVEFGDVATKAPYQRFDIFDADGPRVARVLTNFPQLHLGKAKPNRKAKLGNASLLRRPQLISPKESD
jgi:hypothetical protein